ncbi:MAG: hypothetical protein J7L56_09075 [Halomonas sp.]|nr:hypothetical protein [Halomonas sp.]MCD6438397.1 hypothetical protein [Halomonas sp.]
MNANTWQQCVYSNFGGVGNQPKDYKSEMVQRDMDSLFASKNYRAGLGAFGIKIIQQFFDSQKVHYQLLGIYRLAIVFHSLERGFNVCKNGDVASKLVTPKK